MGIGWEVVEWEGSAERRVVRKVGGVGSVGGICLVSMMIDGEMG